MLTVAGRGVLRDVRSECDEEGATEGVAITLEIEDEVFSTGRSTTILVHWMCGSEESRSWLALNPNVAKIVCHFSGVGPRLWGDSSPLFELVASSVSLDIRNVSQIAK